MVQKTVQHTKTPSCLFDLEHDWRPARSVQQTDNGYKIKDVCAHCGQYKSTYMESGKDWVVEYHQSDKYSWNWALIGIVYGVCRIIDESDGRHHVLASDAKRIHAEMIKGQHFRGHAEELLEYLKERLKEAEEARA